MPSAADTAALSNVQQKRLDAAEDATIDYSTAVVADPNRVLRRDLCIRATIRRGVFFVHRAVHAESRHEQGPASLHIKQQPRLEGLFSRVGASVVV